MVGIMKQMSEKKIQEILNKHRVWIESNGNSGKKGDFSNLNLKGVNFRGLDLSYCQFQRSNLEQANLGGANLSFTNLSFADLQQANLGGATIIEANLTNANLSRTKLGATNFFKSNLSNVNFAEAGLTGANLNKAILNNANLGGATLLSLQHLDKIDLSNTIFESKIKATIDKYSFDILPDEFKHRYKDKFIIIDIKKGINGLNVYFDFPEHLRTACEQYLLYFRQFLHDFSILTDVSITQIGENTLFSVIPLNKEDALINIQNALGFYLAISMIPEEKMNFVKRENQHQQIIISRLKAECLFLKSRLESKHAENHALKIAVNALESNTSYNEEYINSIFLLSIKYIEQEGKRTDSKEFISDFIRLTSLKLPGFEIDIDEILKKTFRWIQDKMKNKKDEPKLLE